MTSIAHTPAAVAAYCATHTNAEAAAHFQLNERTIRKLKARAHETLGPAPVAVAPAAAEPPALNVTLLTHIPDEWIARDGQLWKCGRCGELSPPLPGTTGAEWNARGCYLHQVEPTTHSQQIDSELIDELVDEIDVCEVCQNEPESDDRTEPLSETAPRAVPIRIVVRVPVEQSRSAWWMTLSDRYPPQMLAAVAIAIVLIVICYA